MQKKHHNLDKIALCLLALNLLIAALPALTFSLPFTQWDAGVYYTLTQAFDKGGFNAPYSLDPSITKVSDHPILLILYMWLGTKLLPDMWVINGFLIAIAFVFANYFVYLFAKKASGKADFALLVLVYAALNIRAYYSLLVGVWATFFAVCLAWSALYFTYDLFKSKANSKKNFGWMLLFTILTILAHTITGAFLVFLQLMIYLGTLLEEKVKFNWKININLKQISKADYKPLIYMIIPVVFLFYSIFRVALIPSRESWISPWVSGMLEPYGGFQRIWQFFLLLDGPIITISAILGLIYLIYSQKWRLVLLFSGGLLIVLARFLFVSGDVGALIMHFNKFYVMFYVFIAIAGTFFLYGLAKRKETRSIALTLLTISILFQIAKVGAFYSLLSPAITQEELESAQFLNDYREDRILYINKIDSGTSFRSFSWIYFISNPVEGHESRILDDIPPDIHEKIIYVSDYKKLSNDENARLRAFKVIHQKGNVRIYQK